MTEEKKLMEFPCDFRIKIIGTHKPTFLTEMMEITRKHFPDTKNHAARTQESQQSNFLSVTITLYVEKKTTLDLLYQELTQHPDVKWVL